MNELDELMFDAARFPTLSSQERSRVARGAVDHVQRLSRHNFVVAVDDVRESGSLRGPVIQTDAVDEVAWLGVFSATVHDNSQTVGHSVVLFPFRDGVRMADEMSWYTVNLRDGQVKVSDTGSYDDWNVWTDVRFAHDVFMSDRVDEEVYDAFDHLGLASPIVTLATRQLVAYNAADLDAFCECYAKDVVVLKTDGSVDLEGLDAFRARYADMFARGPEAFGATIDKRTTDGQRCVEREQYWRVVDGKRSEGEVLVEYQERDGRIGSVQFFR